MTHLHTNNDKVFCFVEVPEEAYNFQNKYLHSEELWVLRWTLPNGKRYEVELPSGTWHNPKRVCDLTEEEKAEIVAKEFDTYRNYEDEDQIGSYMKESAAESFKSLLSSIGMKEESTVVLWGR